MSQLGKGWELGLICLLRELDFSLNFVISSISEYRQYFLMHLILVGLFGSVDLSIEERTLTNSSNVNN